MATTTNYSWTTPDDTALVKDGASAIRTLGSSVDTTVKNLNPETTLGDLAYRSSTANVKTRLGLGTAGQVLTVNSGATAPEWAAISAGGMTLISTTTLSGVSTAITSIPSTYNSLQISWELIDISSNDDVKLLPNNTANTFNQIYMQRNDTTNALGGANLADLFITPQGFKSANTQNAGTIIINNYASAAAYKPFQYYAHSKAGLSATNNHVVGGGVWASNTAISSLYFTSPSSISGGTVRLYGVK